MPAKLATVGLAGANAPNWRLIGGIAAYRSPGVGHAPYGPRCLPATPPLAPIGVITRPKTRR